MGVVTINLPRIAYLAKDEADFFVRLDRMMDLAARSLKIKRTTVEKLLEEGLYPYTKRYLGGFDNHFSTIGLVGMNEAGLNANWLRKDLTHEETQNFAVRVLKHMRERLSDYQELYGDLYNLRQPRRNPPPTAWPSTTRRAIPISSPHTREGRLTTPIPAICPLATPRMCLRRWMCRISFRPSIPAARCSTLPW